MEIGEYLHTGMQITTVIIENFMDFMAKPTNGTDTEISPLIIYPIGLKLMSQKYICPHSMQHYSKIQDTCIQSP